MFEVIAELAQSVERTTLNRVVVGSIPTFGVQGTFCFGSHQAPASQPLRCHPSQNTILKRTVP